MKMEIIMSQQTQIIHMNGPQQQYDRPTELISQQQASQNNGQVAPLKKPARAAKIRRTRQSRNPQLSVARRNERERNRVKMVNNGFAVLRDHLPVEYLQATAGELGPAGADSGCETPDGAAHKSGSTSAGSKAKKFSKVETLRAAIQHIRMLEELIRSAEPGFESINIPASAQVTEESLLDGYDEFDNGPLSIGEPPASCASSSGASSSQPLSQQQSYSQMMYEQQTSEQFIKLEPQLHQQHQQIQPPHAYPMTQVQHAADNLSEHTHLWIQQQQTNSATFSDEQHYPGRTQWYPNSFVQQQQQQQQQQLVVEQQLSPVSLDSPAGQMQQQQQQQHLHHLHPQQQQQQIWYAESSPSPQSQILQQAGQQPFVQQHQISLYSQ